MDGFERRRQQKKEAILNAAQKLFNQYGFDKVTIAEIAKGAPVSQASVYNFFKSKENLKHELKRKLRNDYYLISMEILESSDPIKLKLEKLLVSRVEFYGKFSKHFLAEFIDNDTFAKDHNIIGEEDYQNFTNAFLNLIEEGKKEGIFNDSISTQAMNIYLEIIRYYFANNPSATAKFANNPELTREIFTLFSNALLNK